MWKNMKKNILWETRFYFMWPTWLRFWQSPTHRGSKLRHRMPTSRPDENDDDFVTLRSLSTHSVDVWTSMRLTSAFLHMIRPQLQLLAQNVQLVKIRHERRRHQRPRTSLTVPTHQISGPVQFEICLQLTACKQNATDINKRSRKKHD